MEAKEDLDQKAYKYQIKEITHLPDTQATISDLKEFKEESLEKSRELAVKEFKKELESLEGQYSPDSYNTYDPEKGVGYNRVLLLIDESEDNGLVIDSSFYDNDKVVHDREVEKKIFMKLGLKHPEVTE